MIFRILMAFRSVKASVHFYGFRVAGVISTAGFITPLRKTQWKYFQMEASRV